jgi:Lysophospholipase
MNGILNEVFLARSESYSEAMDSVILPFLESEGKNATVPGENGRPLYCVSFQPEEPLATVFMVHGFTENAYKYSELVYSLLMQHYAVVIYDQRGHGRSWRSEGIPDPSVTHVDHFDEYVADLESVVRSFQSMPRPFLLFAHSMGGAVASLFLERHPDIFSAAVLSSPMIAPNLHGLPKPVVYAICSAAAWAGKEKKNPFFMGTYSGPEDFSTSCATDPNRFAWYDKVKSERPEFQNSVPSYRWTLESARVTDRILAKGAPEKIACPVLLFSADKDSCVLPNPQKDFISRVPQGTRFFVKDSRHEIFRSKDDVLYPWWKQVLAFFRKTAAEY